MSDATKAAPGGLQEVVELLPAGKVPGGFERAFCQIFRDEIQRRFSGQAPAAAPTTAGE